MVEDGAEVEQGAVVAIVEAMKMETQVVAPARGHLSQSLAIGAAVEAGMVIGQVM